MQELCYGFTIKLLIIRSGICNVNHYNLCYYNKQGFSRMQSE